MPAMRRSGAPPPRPGSSLAAVTTTDYRLLIGLRLAHDLLGGEADLAGRERIPDEEVVRQLRIEIRAFLDVREFHIRRRQRDRLWHLLALERGDRRLDRHGDLGRSGSGRRAMQSLRRVLRAQLAEAILGLAGDRDHGVFRIEQCAHGARRAALDIDAVELLVHGDRVRGGLLCRAVVPLADHLDDLDLLARLVEDLVEADVAIAVDRVARRAAHLEQLAALRLDLRSEEHTSEPQSRLNL